MKKTGNIITVGLCPCWDITCKGKNLEWGRHKTAESVTSRPAGKALNISRALAWMGQANTAAGLWGSSDHRQMLEAAKPLGKLVKLRFTVVAGSTRQNVTIVDTAKNKEMHLRAESSLASKSALGKLKLDLRKIIGSNNICVFAGSMPQRKYLDDVIRIIKSCNRLKANIALDTSGAALKEIVKGGGLWLIKPNVEELGELLGKKVKDTVASLANAGQQLLEKVDIVLISRGGKGAVVVSKGGIWKAQVVESKSKVLSTVGCGDYLLAGFLKGLKDKSDISYALKTAIKVATAKAWGWTNTKSWAQTNRQIKVEVSRI